MDDQKKAYQIFSSFKQQYYEESESKTNFGNTGNILNMDEDIKIIIQRLNKKSKKTTTTRVKALQQLQEILTKRDEAYVARFIKLFMVIYEKILMGEIDTKVLVELHKCMNIIITRCLKEVQKNFASIFHLLLFATFEPNPDIADVSKQNLRHVLKDDKKIARALFMFKEKTQELIKKIMKADELFIKEVSVYDEKEINDIIHNKLIAMTFNYTASILRLSSELEKEERDQVHDKLMESMCKDESDTQNIIGMFNTYKQSHIIRAAIVNFFSKVFQIEYTKYLNKKQVKNVMSLFLVHNINDDNAGAQKYYWEENFILKLLKESKNYGIDILSLENQFVDLFRTSGFSAGESYYRSLPKLLEIILADKNRNKAIKFVTKLITTHFEAIAVNEFKFDIQTHFKYGFELIDTLLKNLEDSQEKSKIKEIFIDDILLNLVELFINYNNPKQRNLLVLGINNAKHIPIYLIEYLKSLHMQNLYSEMLENELPRAVGANLAKLLKAKEMDRDKIINYGIFESMLLKQCASPQNMILTNTFLNIFNQVKDLLKYEIENINDVEFESQSFHLTTLKFFFSEIFVVSNKKILENIMAENNHLKMTLNDFISFINDTYLYDVIENKLEDRLIDTTSQTHYKYIIGTYVKVAFVVTDYDIILMRLNEKIQQRAIGSSTIMHDLLIFLSDLLSLQLINALDTSEDLNNDIANIIDTKFWLKSDFMEKMSKSPAFEALFMTLLKHIIVYKNYKLLPIVVGYVEKDNRYADICLETILYYREDPKNIKFANYEVSIYKFVIIILKNIQVEEINKFTDAMAIFLNENNYEHVDSLLQEFEQISDKKQLSVFESMLKQVLNKKINIKFVQSYISDILMDNAKMNTLSDIFYDFTVACIKSLSLEDVEIAEAYRKISKKITDVVDIGKTSELILKNLPVQTPELLTLFCQASIIPNITVSKRRIFWSKLLFNDVINSILKLADTADFNIAALYKSILQNAFTNVALQKFCFYLIKTIFKEDSILLTSIKWTIFDLTLFTLQDAEPKDIIPVFEELCNNMKDFIVVNKIYDKVTYVTRPKSPCLELQSYILDPNLTNSDVIDLEIVEKATSMMSAIDLTNSTEVQSANTQLTIFVYLQLMDLCYRKDRQDIISTQIELLEKCFSTVLSLAEEQFKVIYSQNTFVQLLILLRKFIHIIEVFSDELQKTLLSKILQLSFHFASNFQSINKNIFTVPPERFVEEIAETISRFALRENSALSVDNIIVLMSSDINSLKKSCYFLLNQFKEFTQIDDNTLSKLQDEEIDVDNVIAELPLQIEALLIKDNQFDNFTYFLLWSFILRSMSEDVNSNKTSYSLFKEIFKHKKEIYMRFLYRIFHYFKQKQFNDRQVIELLSHIDFKNPETVWGETINEQTKEAFAINCLLLFSSKFPKNLRKWIESADKSLSNIALLMLKQGISNAIFDLEVDQIELSQYSWKTDEFNIYIYRKTREIYAVFSQEDTRIEVALKVPENYPVNLINIELNKEAKIQKLNTHKYILQIKKLLTNQNYSIIEALIHWKKNIENEFQGISPCSICYYVLHESSKRVPNKACKTCKNKFHTVCIHKWFQTSNKSECPLCKSQFL